MAAGLADYPLIDHGHQAGVFGGFEEFFGRDQALCGTLPANQGFKPNDLPGMDLKDGLVEDAELAAIESSAQIGFELQTGDGAIVHAGIEQLGAVATHRLSAAESGFSIAQGIVGSSRLDGAEGTADADVRAHLALLEDEGSGHGGMNALGDAKNVTGISARFQQNGELIASKAREYNIADGAFVGARDRVGAAEASLQAKADFDEDLISGGSAHGVVESLKGVDVHQQEGVPELGIPLRLREAALETV
jgi:hypothetical protein